MVKNHKRQQSAARRIAAFDCHWLSEVLQELSEVHVAIELHLFTQPVARHFHAARQTLADVDYGYALVAGLLQQADEPRLLGGVAAAETPHDD